ncbi:hypothetical protein OEZ60_21855 [Defluviimonas sp. WL0024]|uniref:Uncharacterized protein n=1 Tax=Albidovulum salinarum TaxID=2984153 RepID=A0ABT2X9I8_9RHOB|nr:hypothetical protein [Defluviimonas sp. WL0024]
MSVDDAGNLLLEGFTLTGDEWDLWRGKEVRIRLKLSPEDFLRLYAEMHQANERLIGRLIRKGEEQPSA